MYRRFAIFYTPEASEFAEFGAQWLGWDSATGKEVAHPEAGNLDVAALTATPRKYGFHATLKAPFRLAEGAGETDLIKAADAFASSQSPARADGLTLIYQHGFLALRPDGNSDQLGDLAGQVVRIFEPLRAALNDAEIARRRQSRLSARQDAQMLKWGYPYVFDDFHFHMTLTGRLSKDDASAAMPVVRRLAEPVLPRPFSVDSITLMGEDSAGKFHQLHRATFLR